MKKAIDLLGQKLELYNGITKKAQNEVEKLKIVINNSKTIEKHFKKPKKLFFSKFKKNSKSNSSLETESNKSTRRMKKIYKKLKAIYKKFVVLLSSTDLLNPISLFQFEKEINDLLGIISLYLTN